MTILPTLAQVFIALAMFDVWLLRYDKPQRARGGDAKTMAEEFAVYGLPAWFRNVVRALKLASGTLMIVGIWYDQAAFVAGAMLVLLMGGAGLTQATKVAILNANYIAARLQEAYPILYTSESGRVAQNIMLAAAASDLVVSAPTSRAAAEQPAPGPGGRRQRQDARDHRKDRLPDR